MLADSEISRNLGEPLHFDEEEDSAICKVNSVAINHIFGLPIYDEAAQNDRRQLKGFIAQYGAASIYEYSTF